MRRAAPPRDGLTLASYGDQFSPLRLTRHIPAHAGVSTPSIPALRPNETRFSRRIKSPYFDSGHVSCKIVSGSPGADGGVIRNRVGVCRRSLTPPEIGHVLSLLRLTALETSPWRAFRVDARHKFSICSRPCQTG